jgi:hypothetical protein
MEIEETAMKKSIALAAFATFCLTGAALATDCVAHVKRTACPGQEAESYKKCNGAAECDKNEDAATTEAACQAAAARECDNKRTARRTPRARISARPTVPT